MVSGRMALGILIVVILIAVLLYSLFQSNITFLLSFSGGQPAAIGSGGGRGALS